MADATVKMGVSGIAQFKQGMKEAQNSVKTLDAQLKLNEQQFKATGDAETYMQQKSELLQKQIAEQERVVKQAEQALTAMTNNGVKQSSTAYQQMQQQMIRAQTELISMQNDLNGVGTAGEDAADGVDQMNDELSRIGKNVSFDAAINGIEGVTGALEAAAKKAWNLGVSIVNATLAGGQWADELATDATKYGLTNEELYRMQQTARIIDTETDTIISAKQKLTQGLGRDSQEVLGAFADLISNGLLPEDYDPRKMKAADVFWDAGEALMKLNDEYDQQVYAQALYGKSWKELVPLFKAGRETYEETMSTWTWVGDEQFEQLTKLNDEEQKLTSEWEAFQHQFEAALAPAMTSVMETMTALLKEFNTYLQSPEGQEMMQKMGEVISGFFEDITKIDPEEAMATLQSALTGITDAFTWLIENKEDVVDALKWIIGGWAALKLTGGALQVLQLLNGLNGLTNGFTGGQPSTGSGMPNLVKESPVTTSGTPGAEVAAGGGLLAKLGTGLSTMAQTAAFIAPAALLIDGIVRDQQMIQESIEKGEQRLAEVAEQTERYKDSDMFNIWRTLTDYTSISGGTQAEDTEAAAAFAREWLEWLDDTWAENPMFDKLSDMMSQEEWEQFNQSMYDLANGAHFYGQEELDEFYAPIERALELIETQMEIDNAKPQLTPDDIGSLKDIPAQVGDAVRDGMANVTIVIDGSAVDAMMPRISSNQASSFFHNFP